MPSQKNALSHVYVELPMDLVACHLQVPRYIITRLALQLQLITPYQLKQAIFFDAPAITQLQVAVSALKKGVALSDLKASPSKSKTPRLSRMSTLYEQIQEGKASFPKAPKKTMSQNDSVPKQSKPKVFQVQKPLAFSFQ